MELNAKTEASKPVALTFDQEIIVAGRPDHKAPNESTTGNLHLAIDDTERRVSRQQFQINRASREYSIRSLSDVPTYVNGKKVITNDENPDTPIKNGDIIGVNKPRGLIDLDVKIDQDTQEITLSPRVGNPDKTHISKTERQLREEMARNSHT